ncbi:MAG: hypothetical protein IJJ23_03485 [Clostridia bacterium]|nr:hypothetical protein [Clostridia bacterium]
MTINEAIKALRDYYSAAVSMPYIHSPVAWALYQTWKAADVEAEKAGEYDKD